MAEHSAREGGVVVARPNKGAVHNRRARFLGRSQRVRAHTSHCTGTVVSTLGAAFGRTILALSSPSARAMRQGK